MAPSQKKMENPYQLLIQLSLCLRVRLQQKRQLLWLIDVQQTVLTPELLYGIDFGEVTNFELLIMMQVIRRRLTKYVLNDEALERKL